MGTQKEAGNLLPGFPRTSHKRMKLTHRSSDSRLGEKRNHEMDSQFILECAKRSKGFCNVT